MANARLRLRDLDSGQNMVFTLVFPSDADAEQSMVSVLAPLRTAALGFRRVDPLEWRMPGRVSRCLGRLAASLQGRSLPYRWSRGSRIRHEPRTVVACEVSI
jgi:hypothetical protein